MELAFERLDPIGAQLVDPDVDVLLRGPSVPEEVLEALDEHGVLLFRGLHLDDGAQLAFSRRLGEVVVKRGPGSIVAPGWSQEHPGIYRIALDAEANDEFYVKGSWDWHIDGSTAIGSPPKASLLSCRVTPGRGGETEFVSTYAAYDLLTSDERAHLAAIKVWHKIDPALYSTPMDISPERLERILSEPAHLHPLVWTHRNGRRSLVIGVTASHVEGMTLDDGRALLDGLLARATRRERVLSHVWEVGDLVIWDNRGTMHRARPYAEDAGRDMRRVTLVGDEPIQ